MKDYTGLTVTADNSNIIDEINIFIQNMVNNGAQAVNILNTVTTYPDNFLTQCYAGSLYLFGQTAADINKAKQHLSAAEKHIRNANDRERLTFQALTTWADQDFIQAIALFRKITQDYPKDLLAGKYMEFLTYLMGDEYRAPTLLAMWEEMKPHQLENPYFYSSYAFALELSGQREQAIIEANKSIALDHNTPWAHHALAHAHLLLGKIETGIEVLEKLKPTWDQASPISRAHNLWHLGLMYIGTRESDKVMDAYHQAMTAEVPDTVLGQLDMISFLWRMEMAGLDHQQSWQAVVDKIKAHADFTYVAFNSMHFIYACARAGEHQLVQQILNNAQTYAQQSNGFQAFVWNTVALPVLNACHCFANEDYKHTIEHLQPVLKQINVCGGSDAQIEVLKQMYCCALIKAKKVPQAQQFYQQQLAFYKNTALESYWF